MTEKDNCPICNADPIPVGMEDGYELDNLWLNAEPQDCIKRVTHVTAKRLEVHLFELDDNELLGLMKEVNIYSQAIKNVTGCVKINLELHGNTLLHLHFHWYFRYLEGDPYPEKPIDYNSKTKKWYKDSEFENFVRVVSDEITRYIYK